MHPNATMSCDGLAGSVGGSSLLVFVRSLVHVLVLYVHVFPIVSHCFLMYPHCPGPSQNGIEVSVSVCLCSRQQKDSVFVFPGRTS